jgi:hypothetical protein
MVLKTLPVADQLVETRRILKIQQKSKCQASGNIEADFGLAA